MKTKILSTKLSERDRYLAWHRLGSFAASTLKEERLQDATWETLGLQAIQDRIDATRPQSLDVPDFDDTATVAVELDREELSFLLGTLLTPSERRPIYTALGRYTAPLRRRLEAERDVQGMKTDE
jgi:hypothetical protein